MKRIFTALLAALAALAQFSPAHAADWSKPLTTSTYTNFVTEVKNRDTDLALGFDPAYTTPTNISTNTIRWSSAAGKWQKWNGTTWGDLATGYAISITGNAATATALATARTINGVSFNGAANISVNTVNALTFNNGGAGAVSGSTFNGSAAQTISYNTIGAPSATGGSASGTWGISITGTAAHLAGGSAGTTPYQTAAGTTAQLAAGTNGYYKRANGAAAPSWEAPSTVFANIKQAATEAATGVVELATTAEAAAGTDTTRAVTAAGVKAAIDAISPGLTLMTAQATTSGTFKDFTGIPSWVSRITVTLQGVSTNGTSVPIIQIGSGSFVTTGYSSSAMIALGSGMQAASFTTGFAVTQTTATLASLFCSGTMTLTRISGNTWVAKGTFGLNANAASFGGGDIALSGALDRIRLTTVNATDAFDAGSVNVMYE